jgi:type IV pilus assembly protein PilA
MLLWIHDRLRKDDKGFTLIELMVVVLIIAILIAIAIPTFLGARKRAQDRQAQSNLRNALTSEKTYYADAQIYTGVATDLSAIETNINFTTRDAASRGALATLDSAAVPANQAVEIESLSKSGTMFCILDVSQTLTTAANYNGSTVAGTYYAKDTGGASCTSSSTWGPTTASW